MKKGGVAVSIPELKATTKESGTPPAALGPASRHQSQKRDHAAAPMCTLPCSPMAQVPTPATTLETMKMVKSLSCGSWTESPASRRGGVGRRVSEAPVQEGQGDAREAVQIARTNAELIRAPPITKSRISRIQRTRAVPQDPEAVAGA